MAIDFPNSPAVNDTYTVGNKTWIYDGTAWNTYNTTSFSAETLPGTNLKSTVTGSSLTSVGTLGSLTVTGDVTVDTNTLKVDSTNNRVGVNTTSPTVALDVTGAGKISGDFTVDTNTLYVDSTNNRVGVANLGPLVALDVNDTVAVRNNQGSDGVAIKARSAGTSYYLSTLTPTTLTADRTLTLPDATGTVALTSDPGLQLVKTQTIGTAVSSVTVTGAFSSTYDAYKIIISSGVGSTNANLALKLGSSTTGYYSGGAVYTYSAGSGIAINDNNAASFTRAGQSDTGTIHMDVTVMDPALAKLTKINFWYALPNTTSLGGMGAGFHNVATAYTDFTLTPSAGTLTGGTIRVYGYRN